MIYVGIDISKYKYDCFICKDTSDYCRKFIVY